jgi:guanylate kinase
MTLGPLIIVAGPSGSGKSTLIRRVLEAGRYPLHLSVSATTRAQRPGERDGMDYHFWTVEQFQEGLRTGRFLEHAVVHGQNYYGTLRDEVDAWRARGYGVILDIDVQGAEQVRRLYPDHVSVFIKLSSWPLYEQRLRQRGSETNASIARRLETARRELERVGEFQHVIINDDLELAGGELLDLIGRFFATPKGTQAASAPPTSPGETRDAR